MAFDMEREIALLLSKHYEKPIMRDPYKEKMMDHKRRQKYKADKESKSNRKEHYRSFRLKNKRLCREAEMVSFHELENLIEPVLKKTS